MHPCCVSSLMRSIPRQNPSYIGGVITFTPRRVTASSIDSKCEPPDRPVPPGRRTALSPAHCRSRLPDPNSQDPSIAAEPTRCRYLPPAAKCVHRGDCIVGRHTAAAVKTAGETDASPEPNAVLRWSRLHSLVCYKRLAEEPVEQLTWLLDGLDLKQLKPHRKLEYRTVL